MFNFDDIKNKDWCIYCNGQIPYEEEIQIRHENISEVLKGLLTERISCKKEECEEKKEMAIEEATDRLRGKF